jgi:hypothetical protein
MMKQAMYVAEFLKIYNEQGEDAAIAWAEREMRLMEGKPDKAELEPVE